MDAAFHVLSLIGQVCTAAFILLGLGCCIIIVAWAVWRWLMGRRSGYDQW